MGSVNIYHIQRREDTFRNQNTRWPCLDEHVDFSSWYWIVLYSQWLLPVVLLMREYGYKLGPSVQSQPKLGSLWIH